MLEILDQCGADLLGQGQHPLAAALAGPQAELPRPPVQVVELKGGDLAGAQAEARQKQHDCPVAILRRAGCGGRLQQSHELLGGQVRRQAGVPRAPDARDGAVEPAWRGAAPSQETQEGARRTRGHLAAVSRSLRSLPAYELGHLLDGQPGPVGSIQASTGRNEAPHDGQVARPCGVGRSQCIPQAIDVAGSPGGCVTLYRVHHPLPAAMLAAGGGSLDYAEPAMGRTRVIPACTPCRSGPVGITQNSA